VQNEITQPIQLLNSQGNIISEGWARYPLWQYDRGAIKAGALRIKEWDYYSILSPDQGFGLTITASDLGYAGLFALCFLDFRSQTYTQIDTLGILPLGKTGFSPDSDSGQVLYKNKTLSLQFLYRKSGDGIARTMTFEAQGLKGEIELKQPADLESINIATSWAQNRRAFYYNRKINCIPARGSFTFGSQTYSFDPARDFGALDWGRGNWTYKNRWYWGSGSGYVDGVAFGFNIGYGFSDRTPASENCLVYEGKIHKLEDVVFHIPPGDYMAPWKFSSNDQRFEMDFVPLVDRTADTNLGIIRSAQHQVFGHFSGTAILDGGRKIKLEKFLGFAEDVYNRW